MNADFPLVLSMSQFQHYRRCKKMFEFSAIHELTPRRDNEAAASGRSFHEILAYAARHRWQIPEAFDDPDMLKIARDFIRDNEMPPVESIFAVEQGFFAEVAPAVFIRGTLDLGWHNGNMPTIDDYKTFMKAPSLDADLDHQAQEYLVILEAALGATEAEFRWRYVRREDGRFLKKDGQAVWTPWEHGERYMEQTLVLTPEERAVVKRELYDCALDIRQTIEAKRYYRTGLNGMSPHTCHTCFFKDLCKTEKMHGRLDAQDLELLTMPADPSERVHPFTMTQDPRVKWYMENFDHTLDTAVTTIYGNNGRAAVQAYLAA